MQTFDPLPSRSHSADLYRRLLRSPVKTVDEPDPTLDPFSERHLQCVWHDRGLRPPNLLTLRGESVEILYPGRWNLESGPDFLDAEWRVGGRRIRGDVEIHIRPMDWRHHGHGDDPAFRNVRLHVTYDEGELPPGVLPAECEQICLKPVLAARKHFFFDRIDPERYPWNATVPDSELHDRLAELDDAQRGDLLEAAGRERLRRKTLRMGALIRSAGTAQALYQTLMRGLGYKANPERMEALSRALPLSLLRALAGNRPEAAHALLLGCGGLLPPDPDAPGPRPPWVDVRRMWDVWWPCQERFSDNTMSPDSWNLGHCRPGNHPIRRLAAAARWWTTLPPLEAQLVPSEEESETEWVRRCMRLLQPPSPGNRGVRVVGRSRAGALFLNAVLPWRLARGHARPEPSLWKALPSEPLNAKARHAAYVLFGPDASPRIFRGGLRRQGLLQFHEDFGF